MAMRMPVWLIACALLAVAPARADVYKYIDAEGNVVFSDEPLSATDLRLEWKRANQRLVAENRQQSRELRKRDLDAQAQFEAARQALRAQRWLQRARPTPALADGSLAERRAQYRGLIELTARQYNLWPELLHAVIRTESSYRADALSSAGACGLMQLMPGTAERFKVRDIWDPVENIRGGASYLRFLLDLFQNDLRLALAGYNAGENAVKRHGYDIPPYPETQDYVRKVLRFLHAERQSLRS